MRSTPEATSFETLNDIRMIDCDAHFTEPPDLWSSRAPRSMQDQMPVLKTIDGVSAWYLDGLPWASTGGNTIEHGRTKVLGRLSAERFEEIDPAAYGVRERVDLLDDLGIRAQVVYPNGLGFASNHIFAIEDENVRRSVLEIYNDFCVDVQHESNGRILPQAMLPVWDMDFTVGEMSRLLSKGIVGFTISDRPELLGLPELNDRYFDPMWDTFDMSGAVVNFHIGSGARREEIESRRLGSLAEPNRDPSISSTPTVAQPYWASLGPQRRLAASATQAFMSNARIISNLCMGDLFDRYSNLKVVSVESGIGWVPFVLECLEYQFDEMVSKPEEQRHAKRRPREYFDDHIFVMFWFERDGIVESIERIGSRNVLVETDIPHPTCLFPGTREYLAESLRDLDPVSLSRILHDNAAELYQIDSSL